MKRLFLLQMVCACFLSSAQLSISTSTNGQCLDPSPSATVMAWVAASPSNAATYSWSVVSPSCSASFTAMSASGSSIAVSYPCCGVFTITCSAYTSTSSIITTTTTQMTVYCLPTVTPSVSPSPVCSGNTVTFTALSGGAVSYTWIAANNNHPQNGVGYFASVTQNYTVIGASAQGCAAAAVISLSVVNTPTQAPVASPFLICIGNSATLSAAGASNYSWTAAGSFPGSANPSVVVTPSVTTTYTVTKWNGSCVDIKTVTVIVNNLPSVFAVAAPPAMCLGGTSTLTAGGGVTYTWSGPGLSSFASNAVVSPTVNTIYTVTASDGTCVNTATTQVSVIPAPTISIVASNSILCAGQCASVTVSGASNYTWSTVPASPPPSGTLAVVCPTVSTNYMVSGTNGSCTAQGQQIILVNPQPSLSISAQPPIIACGSSATLQVVPSGASTYSWSSGATTNTTVVTPLQSGCFNVTVALQSSGCMSSAAVCVTVNPAPLTPSGNSTVCLGSSANLSVTVPGSFTWQPGSLTGSLVNVIPQSLTIYSVAGTLTNACAASGTISVFPDPSCAIVWPGDANSDGSVNSSDVFEIGLAFSSTGAARTTTGNAWNGHFASAWTGTVSSGKNLVHADCNGDGTINFSDTIAIFNNFSLTHSFREAASQNVPIVIVPESQVAGNGWSRAFIQLASSASPASDVYGVAFAVGFNTTEIANAYIVYPASFMNAGGPNVEFRKKDPSGGAVHAVTVRTDGQAVSGSGTIAEFWYRPKQGLADDTPINFSLSGTKMINASGVETVLSPSGASVIYQENPVGLLNDQRSPDLLIYPNPASGILNVYTDRPVKRVVVYDLPGRKLMEQDQGAAVDLTSLVPGTYVLLIEGEDFQAFRRVVKE